MIQGLHGHKHKEKNYEFACILIIIFSMCGAKFFTCHAHFSWCLFIILLSIKGSLIANHSIILVVQLRAPVWLCFILYCPTVHHQRAVPVYLTITYHNRSGKEMTCEYQAASESSTSSRSTTLSLIHLEFRHPTMV